VTARCSNGTSRCLGTYWTAANVAIQHIAKEMGGFDKLKGKKIALLYHDFAPTARSRSPLSRSWSKKYGFEFLPIPVAGARQRAEVAMAADPPAEAGLCPAVGLGHHELRRRHRGPANVNYPRDKMIGVWWSGAEPGRRSRPARRARATRR